MIGILMTAVVILLTSAIASPYAQDISPQVMTTNHFLPQNKKQESPTDITKEPLEAPVPPAASEEQTSPPVAAAPQPKVRPGAQQAKRPFGAIIQGHKPVTCNDTKIVEKYITEGYKEIPAAMGIIKNKMGAITSVLILYVHPKTNAFSFVEHAATGMSCILAEGVNLEFLITPNLEEQQMVKP